MIGMTRVPINGTWKSHSVNVIIFLLTIENVKILFKGFFLFPNILQILM